MNLRLCSFSPFDTAILPAAGLWTSAAGVTIVQGGGRSGSINDNCAAFDTALGSLLSVTVSPGAVAGVYTATFGLAVRILTVTDASPPNPTTLASIWTAISKFDLVLLSDGTLQILQTTGGVLLGTICETTPEIVPRGTGGCYIEAQIRLVSGVSSACQIRASDVAGEMHPLVQGALLGADAGPYTTFRLGGGVGEEPATWRVTDVYLNDGVPAATPIPYKGRLIYNDSFFGNTHIDALYPTADGTNLSVGNTPWVPDTGAVQYTQIDEHPPDEDDSYIAATVSGQTSTFSFLSIRPAPFGALACTGLFVPIYAIQWDGRLRTGGESADIVPIVREIVTGELATDDVDEGAVLTINQEAYQYYPAVYDRNPLDGDPWTWEVFFPSSVGAPGTTEFGVRVV